ncbi:MAG: hypothetical protein E6Q62_00280 [Nitrosomonas sp.]|nr:MAG: hypothetical protein E6Q62_00280 [Nitrosomonas sp.]
MKKDKRLFKHWKTGLAVITALSGLSGCAVHYYDKKTGAEHIFGFGHMVMKTSAPENSHRAIVTGIDIVGVGLGKSREGGYLSLGWDNRRWIEIIDKNTTVDLVWPNGNFLNTRVGSSWPQNDLQQHNSRGGNHE